MSYFYNFFSFRNTEDDFARVESNMSCIKKKHALWYEHKTHTEKIYDEIQLRRGVLYHYVC